MPCVMPFVTSALDDAYGEGYSGWASTCQSRREEEPGEMKKYWCGETQRIDPIQDAAVPFDQRAVILDTTIALDGRHDETARESHDGDDKSHQRCLGRPKWRRPPDRRSDG